MVVWAADTTLHISRSVRAALLDLCYHSELLLLSFFFLNIEYDLQLLDDNRWYNFDDSHISHINEDDVKSGAAYVLFYRRKSDAGGEMK